MTERTFRLKMHLAPGDITVLTPFVRDIVTTYGDKYRVEVDVNHKDIFVNNPYISRMAARNVEEVDMRAFNGEGITVANAGRRVHFTKYLYEGFERVTGVHVPMLKAKTDLHLSDYERWTPPISGRYWLVFAGGKSDVTIKHWEYERYQQVVNRLRANGIRCVQSGGLTRNMKTKHIHPPLENVTNVVGWGGLREMIWQIYHAEGIICPITAAMHMGSAFDKPVVVIAGGREPPWWEQYSNDWGAFGPDIEPIKVPHRFLHTMGTFDGPRCGIKDALHGCWMNKIVRIDEDGQLCTRPVQNGRKQTLPACMDAISVDKVVDAVMSYYEDGTLPAPNTQEPEPKLIIKDPPRQITIDPLSPQALLNMEPAPPGPMDISLIGGRYTVCVLLYGPYLDHHRRCLDSIVQTLPADRLDLRVATNSVPPQTERYLEGLPITKIYKNIRNRLKFPAMRQLLHDPACPIETNFTVWVDDNVELTRPDWANLLAETIAANHAQNVAMYGDLRGHTVPMTTQKWFQAPAGSTVQYCDGAFWAARTDVLKKLDIPDQRIAQKGGDVLIGDRMRDAGFLLKSFPLASVGRITTTRPRGHIERYPWLPSGSKIEQKGGTVWPIASN